jgi:P27 family predicted phage terminase small subunit
MGRPAKTIRQHLLHGTIPQGKPDKPSVYAGGRAKIPAHLSRAARTEFKRYAKILEDRDTCTPGDFATLALLADCSARWIFLKRQIGEEFTVTTTVSDNHGVARVVSRVNPLLKILAQTESRLQSLLKELGITPKEREKVKQVRPAEPADELIPGTMAWIDNEARKKKENSDADNGTGITGSDWRPDFEVDPI